MMATQHISPSALSKLGMETSAPQELLILLLALYRPHPNENIIQQRRGESGNQKRIKLYAIPHCPVDCSAAPETESEKILYCAVGCGCANKRRRQQLSCFLSPSHGSQPAMSTHTHSVQEPLLLPILNAK